MAKNKVASLEEALAKCHDGMTVMLSGFTNVGSPNKFCRAMADAGLKDLHIIANDAGNDKADGIGTLIVERRARSIVASHVGLNPKVAEQMNEGTLEVTLVPQGTLAERIRCGGTGLGGVLTPTGVGTSVAEGKQEITANGRTYLLELPLRAEVAVVKAWKADTSGNLVYRRVAKNFNPMMAMAADFVIAEVEEIVPVGELDPDAVCTPGVCVDMVVQL
ncbi:MAG: CoA transferase subunit A [Oscillospiraceae bacterium]|nr:CoA transferase subunit A [Oscillospiraceae bacterium]